MFDPSHACSAVIGESNLKFCRSKIFHGSKLLILYICIYKISSFLEVFESGAYILKKGNISILCQVPHKVRQFITTIYFSLSPSVLLWFWILIAHFVYIQNSFLEVFGIWRPYAAEKTAIFQFYANYHISPGNLKPPKIFPFSYPSCRTSKFWLLTLYIYI